MLAISSASAGSVLVTVTSKAPVLLTPFAEIMPFRFSGVRLIPDSLITSSMVVRDCKMYRYTATRELEAVKSELEMEKLVEPRLNELLLTYSDAVA